MTVTWQKPPLNANGRQILGLLTNEEWVTCDRLKLRLREKRIRKDRQQIYQVLLTLISRGLAERRTTERPDERGSQYEYRRVGA